MKIRRISGLTALTLLAACSTLNDVPTARLGTATLKLASGVPVGTAQFLVRKDRVSINVALAGLSEGSRGLHLHAVGQCTGPDFTSAGPHLNPGGHQHGTDNPAGSHLGDLPNVVLNQLGAGTVVAELRGTRAEVEQALFDSDGSAIVIHAAADDYRTDPSGNSGKRVACGVIQRP